MVGHLGDLVKKWISAKQELASNKNLVGEAKLLPYGSFSLGTSLNVDDVDILL
jgi:poly(A) polymerase Pap1